MPENPDFGAVVTHLSLPGKAFIQLALNPEKAHFYSETSGGGFRATVVVQEHNAEYVARRLCRAIDNATSRTRHSLVDALEGLVVVLARHRAPQRGGF